MMTQALTPINGTSHPTQMEVYPREKIELIKRTVAQGTTDDELSLFLYQCSRTGLDPLARQIYCIKRGGKATIQTGIDGYRLIAARTGEYAGSDDPIFCGDTPPETATITVWRFVQGQRCPFTATARWAEYCPPSGNDQDRMWVKMPHTMLAKCGEALALRKAFPAELSGVYTQDEMDQSTPAEEMDGIEQPRQQRPQRAAGQQKAPIDGKATSTDGEDSKDALKDLLRNMVERVLEHGNAKTRAEAAGIVKQYVTAEYKLDNPYKMSLEQADKLLTVIYMAMPPADSEVQEIEQEERDE